MPNRNHARRIVGIEEIIRNDLRKMDHFALVRSDRSAAFTICRQPRLPSSAVQRSRWDGTLCSILGFSSPSTASLDQPGSRDEVSLLVAG